MFDGQLLLAYETWRFNSKLHLFIAFWMGFPHMIILHKQFRRVHWYGITNQNFATYIWATPWQNQQNGCASNEESVWSESSLSAWRNLESSTTHWTHCEDSDQPTFSKFSAIVCIKSRFSLDLGYNLHVRLHVACQSSSYLLSHDWHSSASDPPLPEAASWQRSHHMRLSWLWHFPSSVNLFFKHACAAIQWD